MGRKKVDPGQYARKDPVDEFDDGFVAPMIPEIFSKSELHDNQRDYVKEYCRFLYEVKNKGSVQISKELKSTGLAISHNTVDTWRKTSGWLTRGEAKHDLKSWTRQAFVKAAVEQGYDLKKMIATQIEGITKPEITTYNELGIPVDTKPDYKTRHTYLKDFWAMSGLLQTGKGGGGASIEVTAGEGGIANIQINHPGKD